MVDKILTDKQKYAIEESIAKANTDADYKPWDNSARDEDGVTEAQWEAKGAGEKMMPLPSQIKGDTSLISIYIQGLRQAKGDLLDEYWDLRKDFNEGELSSYFSLHGCTLSEDEYNDRQARVSERLALCESLVSAAAAENIVRALCVAEDADIDIRGDSRCFDAFEQSEGYKEIEGGGRSVPLKKATMSNY